MMKKIILLLLLLLLLMFLPGVSDAERVAQFSELVSPYGIYLDAGRFYVTEGVNIYIYDRKDYRLIKKFGKEGEGPGEFFLARGGGNTEVGLVVQADHIIVNTVNKLVYFTKDGDYIKERKTAAVGRWLAPLGDLFVAKKYMRGRDNLRLHGITIFDADLEEVKEIYRHVHGWQGANKEFNPLTVEQADFEIADDKIFVIDGARSKIMAFDKRGKQLFTVKNDEESVRFTKKDKQEMIEDFKRSSFWNRYYQARKSMFKFPKYFPPIRWFFLDPLAKRLYLLTEKRVADKRKFLVFDFKGNLLEKIMLPLEGIKRFYGGKYYRLVENEEEETWELHVIDLNQ